MTVGFFFLPENGSGTSSFLYNTDLLICKKIKYILIKMHKTNFKKCFRNHLIVKINMV